MNRPEEFGKFQVQFLTGEFPGETDQMGFRVALPAIKSGLRSKVDGGRKSFPIRQVGAAGVNTVGWEALVFSLQIGGGKAQTGSAAGTRSHGSEKGERPAEHFRGVGELSGGNGRTDPAAADPFAGKNDGIRIIEKDFFFDTPTAKKTHIAGPVFAKAPIRADGDGLERGKRGGQFLEKIRRLLPGAGVIKRQGHGQPNLPAFQDAKLVGQAGDEERMFFRVENRERVITKGEDGGVDGDMRFLPSKNHAPMTKMEAVKKTEGEMADGFS